MVSKLAVEFMRGCHPTFTYSPFNDDFFMLSIIDYYRVYCENKHPHPAKYWRFTYQSKWGWQHSITDFKTQSVKEYWYTKENINHKQKFIINTLLFLNKIFHNIPNSNDIKYVISEFLFYNFMRNFKLELKKYICKHFLPISLPYIQPINPMQVFFGRCKQYKILHEKTNQFAMYDQNLNGNVISFHEIIKIETIIKCCQNIPFICVKHKNLYVYNRNSFFKLLRFIHLEDRSYYEDTINTPFFRACNYNLSGIENHSYYKENDLIRFPWLKQKSTIDAWCEDLFGW